MQVNVPHHRGRQELTALSPSRAADIRTKILSGAYHSLDVAEQIARAILQRGDLETVPE